MAFRGTVDRIDGEEAYVTYTEEDESTCPSILPAWLLSQSGIGEGDDFLGTIQDTPDGKSVLRLTLLSRRELTPSEVEAIHRETRDDG